MLRIFVIVNETDETDRNRQTCVYDPGLSKSLPRETLGRVGTLQRATARTRESEQTTDTTRTGVNTKVQRKCERNSAISGKALDFPEGRERLQTFPKALLPRPGTERQLLSDEWKEHRPGISCTAPPRHGCDRCFTYRRRQSSLTPFGRHRCTVKKPHRCFGNRKSERYRVPPPNPTTPTSFESLHPGSDARASKPGAVVAQPRGSARFHNP